MGLDVHLYQFEGVDTDAILKLWQFSEEPWAYEEFEKWTITPPSERGNFPSEKAKAEGHEKLVANARELGLSEMIVKDGVFGGKQITFPSKKHPEWTIGDWYSVSTLREIVEHFTGKNFYFAFPEAEGIHGLFRPDWETSRKRLVGILKELQGIDPRQFDAFNKEFVLQGQMFKGRMEQLEVMIETLDFVLNSDNPKEFLLYWSS